VDILSLLNVAVPFSMPESTPSPTPTGGFLCLADAGTGATVLSLRLVS
jgi:hypothetical protein